jgi:hypothetical protein
LFRKASVALGLAERAENPEELVEMLVKSTRLS